MKATITRVTTLVVLLSLIPFQFAVAQFNRQAAIIQPDLEGQSIATEVTLQGWFHILWGDPQPGQGEGKTLYRLDDGEGLVVDLDFKQSGIPFAYLLSLNNQRISLQGLSSGGLGFNTGNPVLVEEIRLLDDQPLMPEVVGSQPYVSILCKFSDVATEPQDLTFFQNMYANAFPGLDHYWRELSYDNIDLLGSDAQGWFNLPQPRSYYIYDMDSDTVLDADLDRLVTDCTAAADASVYYPDYVGVNMMFNADLDEHSYGGSWTLSLDSVTQSYATTWIADWGYADISVIEHEMGHGFGLPHSSAMYGLVYDNFYDVMSWDRQWNYSDPTYGRTGQHTISYHKDMLGWIAPGVKYTVPTDGARYEITLERRAIPDNPNYLLAVLPVKSSSRFYTLEAVYTNSGYDRNLWDHGVVIHEVDPSREIPAHLVDYDNDGDTRDDAARWIYNQFSGQETFIDATDGISVTVTDGGFNTWYSVAVRITDPFPFSDCASQNQMPLVSCQALLAFYNDTGGASWTQNDHWLGPEWPCRWYGVKCKEEFGDVEKLYFYNNNLTGSLPAEIGGLAGLEWFSIYYSPISGSIPPELGNLPNLYYLDIGGTNLNGSIPPELGDLPSLTHLYLPDNQLTGSIPPELGDLDNLIIMDLNYNQLDGSIPSALGNLSNLVYMDLSENQLIGSIPSELGSLDNLTQLYLYQNELTGSIPETFGDMSSLQYFHAWSNHLSGSLPNNLTSLENLRELQLFRNSLEGALPASIGDLGSLNVLWIGSNKFQGEVPSGITNLTNLYALDLSYNAFSVSDSQVISFLNSHDSDWAQTQTAPPTNLQAVQQGADVLLTWDPILYTGDGGYFEISVSSDYLGPYTVLSTTANKFTSSYLAGGYGTGSWYFRLRTFTPSHGYQQNDLWSLYSTPIGYEIWTFFLPFIFSAGE